jgi:hypothetical protein
VEQAIPELRIVDGELRHATPLASCGVVEERGWGVARQAGVGRLESDAP